MSEKKKEQEYTAADIERMKKWFDEQSDLPESLTLDKATFIPDLRATISYLFDQARISFENPRLYGCIRLLERIRKMLEAKGE